MATDKGSVGRFLTDAASYALLGLAMLVVVTATALVMVIMTLIITGGNWSEALRVGWNILFLGITVIFTIEAALVIWSK